MKATFLKCVAVAFCGVVATSCTSEQSAPFRQLLNNEAIATDNIGFIPSADYPHRDTSYDGYLAEITPVSAASLSTLFNHVAMPQSRSAMVGLLGYAIAEDGDVSYWQLEGGSELAVFFSGDTAYSYTVGY